MASEHDTGIKILNLEKLEMPDLTRFAAFIMTRMMTKYRVVDLQEDMPKTLCEHMCSSAKKRCPECPMGVVEIEYPQKLTKKVTRIMFCLGFTDPQTTSAFLLSTRYDPGSHQYSCIDVYTNQHSSLSVSGPASFRIGHSFTLRIFLCRHSVFLDIVSSSIEEEIKRRTKLFDDIKKSPLCRGDKKKEE